ncbi:MAG: glycosyltransferase family 4 protein [Pyrinomonadaceae bacterium]
MRILQLSSARHFGGGERHFVDLTNGLVRSGHEVFAATTPESPLLPELQKLPAGNILSLPFRKPFDVASAWKLRRFARDRDIEIIHAHVARDYPLASLAAGGVRPRLVLTRHVLFPMGKLHRLTHRRVGRVIAVSEAVAASLSDQKIFDETQITVIRHGIDLERFHSVVGRTEAKTLRVGMLGELSRVKGQKEFVRAAAMIAGQRADVDFIIAGRDNSAEGEYRRELMQSIESAGLTDRISVIESRIDVAEFLAQLDVFVSASSSEAFGLAIAEAMAAGVPVVATASDGAREIIADSQTGRLVPIGDVDELAKRLGELLDDSAERKRLGDNARRKAAEDFSLARMIAETEAVYSQVLNS